MNAEILFTALTLLGGAGFGYLKLEISKLQRENTLLRSENIVLRGYIIELCNGIKYSFQGQKTTKGMKDLEAVAEQIIDKIETKLHSKNIS